MGGFRRQFRLLTRHFFDRFLENDLLSPREGLQAGLAGALAVFLLPGLFLPVVLMLKYSWPFWTAVQRDAASWSDKCLFVSLAMIAMAGLAVLQWDTLRTDRRDYMILLPLPVRTSTILWAKLAALMWLFAVFAVAITSAAPVLFPLVVFSVGFITVAELLRWMAAHAIAVLAAATFSFFGVLAVHGVLLTLLRPCLFRRVSAWVQAAAMFVLAVAFLLLPLIGASARPLKVMGGWPLYAMPAMWFVGLYQTLGGRGDATWTALATLAWASLVTVVAIAVVTELVGYRRHVVATLETPGDTPALPRIVRRLGTRLAAALTGWNPHRHAALSFAVCTLARSSRHRLIVAALLGTGCASAAIALASSMWDRHAWRPPGVSAVMSVQNLLSFFLVAAARFAATVPSELPANWIFRLLAPRNATLWVAGLRRAVLACGVVPLLSLLLPLNAAVLGWPKALSHAAIGLVLSAVLIEIVFFGFSKAPFACSVAPGGGGPKSRWAFYWFGFSLYAFSLAPLEAWALDQPGGFVTLLVTGAVVLVALVAIRSRTAGARAPAVFDEQPDWAMQRLDLSA